MRLTEIVRDLRADADHGRIYLPAEDFRRYRLSAGGPMTPAALAELARVASVAEPAALAGLDGGESAQLYALLRFQALRARDRLHSEVELLTLLDRRSGACVLAITGIYRQLLTRVEERPDRVLGERLSLPAREKAWMSARGVLGRAPRERHPAERLS
jgi:phytoene synthase